jgi:carboxyl-terminal processing protease
MLDEEAWLQYLNSDDAAIKITLDVFKRNESFPKKPQKK